jgi:hypothetical protein
MMAVGRVRNLRYDFFAEPKEPDMSDANKQAIPTVEVVLENPGKYTWRIVYRDPDTGHEVGAPTVSVGLFDTPEDAMRAGQAAGRAMVAGSYVVPAPSSTA